MEFELELVSVGKRIILLAEETHIRKTKLMIRESTGGIDTSHALGAYHTAAKQQASNSKEGGGGKGKKRRETRQEKTQLPFWGATTLQYFTLTFFCEYFFC